MKNKLLTLAAMTVLAGVTAVSLPASAQTTAPANGTEEAMKLDKNSFASAVASSNQLEIVTSQMALKRASSSEVKSFAQQMIDDHTKAGEEFAAAVKQEGLSAPEALMPKHQSMVQELEGASDADFDSAYIALQTAAHTEAVSIFRAYSDQPDSEALGAFAKKTLPTLEKHLEHVKTLKPQQ
ncbi:DUF4142 domain-containing protein [Gellertiella hungarica]|uniref:Putative membrane protein n=1 Tax=Gellertiella hungarica TaxID=1572859 RepID=A0A7W6J9C5_9HYPH|nr:DUF4142 domain-containing protein [Gellertiella hungarica]MBB4067215.1 putative membrane protein [Gellertiella hungarica]